MKQFHRVQLIALLAETCLDRFGDLLMGQQAIAGGRRWVIHLLYFGAFANPLPQFEGGLKVVHIQAHGAQQLRQRLSGHDPGEALVANHFTNHRTILLFNPGLIVFVVWPGARKYYIFRFAISSQRFVDKRPVII